MSTATNTTSGDLDLEYQDVIHDNSNPENQKLEAEIPERYKEKSTDDLIKMHINLEKVLRRQGNEVGQLRKLVDSQTQLLSATNSSQFRPEQRATVEPTKPEPVSAENLLSRPTETLNRAVSQNPSVTAQNQRISQLETTLARKEFEDKHPTYTSDVDSPEFQEWVLASPTRSKLISALHHGYNFAAGAELWELWDEHNAIRESATSRTTEARVQAAKTVKGGSTEAGVSKPIYSRAKLAELQVKAAQGDPAASARWNDPEFQRGYLLAYQEDRVK